jgi:hypothetical protein
MADIIPDGLPPEVPESAANEAYLNIPPTFSDYLRTEALSTTRSLERVTNQGQYEGSGWFPQALYGIGSYEAAVEGAPLPPAGDTKSPMLSPDEYNSRYAPIGNDGNRVSLGSVPMPEAVAKSIGEAKKEEIERENILGRFEKAHNTLTNFGAGLVGFMLDPLRAATAFVPGLGEEAILARLGTGIAARTAARLGAGAITGAVAQAPLSALEYGLGQQEASDYDLRSAMRDILFGAAGNAILHAGAGLAGDVVRGLRDLPATTQHSAMGATIGQMAEGRPVDIAPIFDTADEPVSSAADRQEEEWRHGFSSGVPPAELRATSDEVYDRALAVTAAPQTEAIPRHAAAPPPEAEEIPRAEAEAEQPAVPLPQETQADLDEAERKFDLVARETLLPEVRAEVEQTAAALRDAEGRAAAAIEAGDCLLGSGI